jgi:hypothetical protein
LRPQREMSPGGGVGERRDFETASRAIVANQQKYADIRVPVLAFYAIAQDAGPLAYKNAARKAAEANEVTEGEAQARAFEIGVPSARLFDCLTQIITFF